jgi:hypothetical protein
MLVTALAGRLPETFKELSSRRQAAASPSARWEKLEAAITSHR